MAGIVAKTYGEGLFLLGLEEDCLSVITKEIELLESILTESPELITMLQHPALRKEEKMDILNTAFLQMLSDYTRGFLQLILDKERQEVLTDICQEFLKLVRERNRQGKAYVTSAAELSKKEKKAIKEELLKATSYWELDIVYKIDKEILGGLKIQLGDRVLDNSLKSKLEGLSLSLLGRIS